MFNVLWNILLGIVGGIISSVIVSRVFFIQGEYQQQTKFVDGIIRKLATIRAYLSVCKSVFEVSYDEDIRIEKEMKDKGYDALRHILLGIIWRTAGGRFSSKAAAPPPRR